NDHGEHGVFMPAAGATVVVRDLPPPTEHLPLGLIQGRVREIVHGGARLRVASSAPTHRRGCHTGETDPPSLPYQRPSLRNQFYLLRTTASSACLSRPACAYTR